MDDQHRMPLVEAARFLRIGYYQMHHLVLTQTVLSERVGSRWFVDRRDVQRLAEERARAEQAAKPAAPAA